MTIGLTIGLTSGARRGRAGVTALLASGLVLAATAACSSSGGPDTAGPNATNQPTTSAPAAPTGGTPADAATKQAVTSAYEHFFSGTAAPAVSQQALQHGDAFKAVLEEQAKGQYSKDSGVKVGDITMTGQIANVTFTITSKGAPLLANIKGFAVQDGGTWKVAAVTFCMLLKLQGNPPAVCSDSSITALPQ